MRPATFVKVMKELYMEDFSAIESLWQTLEIEMQVTQKNKLQKNDNATQMARG